LQNIIGSPVDLSETKPLIEPFWEKSLRLKKIPKKRSNKFLFIRIINRGKYNKIALYVSVISAIS